MAAFESAFQSLGMQEYQLGRAREYAEALAYAGLSFAVPFALGEPQLLVGSVVNAGIVMAALNVRGWKLLPVLMLPSVAVIARGIVFGPLTLSLAYMMPFIWVGNFLLAWSVKELAFARKINRWAALLSGSALKAAFLFASAYALVSAGILPEIFLVAMGAMQLYTAIAGGIAAFGLQAIKARLVG